LPLGLHHHNSPIRQLYQEIGIIVGSVAIGVHVIEPEMHGQIPFNIPAELLELLFFEPLEFLDKVEFEFNGYPLATRLG